MYSIMYTMCTVYNVGYRKLKMSPVHLNNRIQYRYRDMERESIIDLKKKYTWQRKEKRFNMKSLIFAVFEGKQQIIRQNDFS